MTEITNRRRSIYETVEKIGEETKKRRSFFENPHLTTEEKEKQEALLEEWNKRWSKHNLDFVNIVHYPKEYVQQLKEEKKMWLKGLDDIANKAENVYEADYELVIMEDILSSEQKESLNRMDFKIKESFENSTMFLERILIQKAWQEEKIEITKERKKFVERLLIAKK